MADDTVPRSFLRRHKALLRTLLGLALLAGLLGQYHCIEELIEALAGVGFDDAMVMIALSVALNLVASLKWGLFLGGGQPRVPYLRLFSMYLMSKFLGNFLPGAVGGDVARSYMLGRSIDSQSASAASVVMERASGMVGLVVVVMVAVACRPAMLREPIVAACVAGAVAGCGVGLLFFFHPDAWRQRMARWGGLPVVGKAVLRVAEFLERLVRFRTEARVLWLVLVISIGFHLLAGLNVYAAARCIGFVPDFGDIMVITPVILMLTMVPVSPNNVGWWEWCFSVLLPEAGGTMAQGLAVALILRAAALVVSLAGGALLLFEGRRRGR